MDLQLAIRMKNSFEVSHLLKFGVSANGYIRRTTSLSIAISCDFADGVRQLIAHGADVNKISEDYNQRVEPPLVKACRLKNLKIVEILLGSMEKTNLDVNGVDLFNHSALWFAVKTWDLRIVQLLLQNGAGMQGITGWHQCPLMLIDMKDRVSCKLKDICRLLISTGCPLIVEDSHKRSDFYRIARNKDAEVMVLLILAGLSPNDEDKEWMRSHAMRKQMLIQDGEYIEWENENIDWLEFHLKNPLSLQCLSRIAVRKCILGTQKVISLEKRIETLEFPTILKRYLMFKS